MKPVPRNAPSRTMPRSEPPASRRTTSGRTTSQAGPDARAAARLHDELRAAEHAPSRPSASTPVTSHRQDVGVADEARGERRGGRVVDLVGRADLLDPALVEHDDAVGQRERLALVVRDVDERRARLAVDAAQLDLHLEPDLEVERRQRLVEQQHAAGRLTSARASATRCIWPPESSCARRCS